MFEKATMNSSFENIIMVNASDKERMRVLVDFDHKNSESDTGKYFDLDLSKHPVLRELFESNSGEIVFERTSSLPIEGNFYRVPLKTALKRENVTAASKTRKGSEGLLAQGEET